MAKLTKTQQADLYSTFLGMVTDEVRQDVVADVRKNLGGHLKEIIRGKHGEPGAFLRDCGVDVETITPDFKVGFLAAVKLLADVTFEY